MPSARPASARLWVSGRSIADPHLSPDGRSVAFSVTNGSEVHLAIVPFEGGAERWMPCEPPVKRGAGALEWLPSGDRIVYLGTDGCVHVLDLVTGDCTPITSLGQPLSSLAVSPDGCRVAYVVDTADVLVTSLERPGELPVRLSSGADFVFDPCWSPDGRYVAWHEWDVPDMPWDGGRICLRDSLGNEGIISVPRGGGGVAVGQPRFSPDGHWLGFLCDENGWMNLWAAPMADLEAAKPLIEVDSEMAPPAWGPSARTWAWAANSESVYFNRNDAGWGSLWRAPLSGDEPVKMGEGVHNALHVSGDRLVAIRRGATEPSVLVAIDHDARSRTLMRSGVEGVGRSIEPEAVEWTSADGTVLHGRLYRPLAGTHERPPLIVWIRGGPHGQSPVTFYPRFGYFVERGFAVLNVDYRGSSGWGREFQQALNGHWGEYDVADVISGIEQAHAAGWGDPERTVLFGGSAGGLTALLIAARRPELVKAAAVMYPVCDLMAFDEETWRFEAHYNGRLVGSLPEAEEEYRRRSPITHVDSIRTPTLILHGDSDNVVAAEQSAVLADRLAANGVALERVVYPGEGHGWRNASTEIDELERVLAFMRTHLSATTDEENR